MRSEVLIVANITITVLQTWQSCSSYTDNNLTLFKTHWVLSLLAAYCKLTFSKPPSLFLPLTVFSIYCLSFFFSVPLFLLLFFSQFPAFPFHSTLFPNFFFYLSPIPFNPLPSLHISYSIVPTSFFLHLILPFFPGWPNTLLRATDSH